MAVQQDLPARVAVGVVPPGVGLGKLGEVDARRLVRAGREEIPDSSAVCGMIGASSRVRSSCSRARTNCAARRSGPSGASA